MKYFIVLFLLCLTAAVIVVVAQPVVGVPVNGPIVPFDSRDLYSTLDPWWASGVFRDATNIVGRDSIPLSRKVRGMMVYTSSDSKYWTLGNDLTTWKQGGPGGEGGGPTLYTGDGSLSGPRLVTLGNNDLKFDATGGRFWVFNADLARIGGVSNLVIGLEELWLNASNRIRWSTKRSIEGSAKMGDVATLSSNDGLMDFYPPPNLYNTDGSLIGNRLVTLGANELKFDATTGRFWVFNANYARIGGLTNIQIGLDELWLYTTNRLHVTTKRTVEGLTSPGDVLTLDPTGNHADFYPTTNLYSADGVIPPGVRTVDGKLTGHLVFTNFASWSVRNSPTNIIGAGSHFGIRAPNLLSASVGDVLTLVESDGKALWQAPPSGNSTNTVTTGTGVLSGGIYTITAPSPPYLSSANYPDFFAVDMKPSNNGGGSDQLKVGSGPSRAIKLPNLAAVSPYDIVSNAVASFVFSAAQNAFILNNPASTLAFDPATLSVSTTNGVSTIAVVGGPSSGPTGPTTTSGQGLFSAGIYSIITPVPPYTNSLTYPDYFPVDMKPSNNSVGGDQVNVGSGPNKPIKHSNLSGISAYDIVSNSVARMVFSVPADAFILINPATTLAFDPATMSTSTTNGVTTVAVTGGGGSPTNIYTADGVIPANRTVIITNNSTLLFDGINKGGTFRTSVDLHRAAGKTNMVIGTEEVFINSTGSGRIRFATSNIVAGATQIGDVMMLTQAGPDYFADFKNLGPLWTYRNGMARRNYANIMFEIDSWSLTSSTGDTVPWTGTFSGGGAVSGIAGTAGHAGIHNVATGVATNGFSILSFRADLIEFVAGNKLYMFARVRLPVIGVTGGEAYRAVLGFGDIGTFALLDTDGINISYSIDESGGAWQLNCTTASANTPQTSGVTVVAGDWYDLEIEATTTEVKWWVNGVQKTSITGGIPSGTQKFCPCIRITAYNGGGATSKIMGVDAYNAFGVYSH